MKTPFTALLVGSLVAGVLMIPTSAALTGGDHDDDDGGGHGGHGGLRKYAVTITNLTSNQIFSPPLLATHGDGMALFVAGEPASADLAELAENGNNTLLFDALITEGSVTDVLASAAPLMPGASTTYVVSSTKAGRLLSAVGMLVSTNDSFFALDGMELPRKHKERVRYLVPAWDAGSEANSENCAFIPGPPCGAGAVHDPSDAEGFVHISNGIHGIGGVPQAPYDWNNPVAMVAIKRL
jgi:hypothetical protein